MDATERPMGVAPKGIWTRYQKAYGSGAEGAYEHSAERPIGVAPKGLWERQRRAGLWTRLDVESALAIRVKPHRSQRQPDSQSVGQGMSRSRKEVSRCGSLSKPNGVRTRDPKWGQNLLLSKYCQHWKRSMFLSFFSLYYKQALAS